LSHHYLFFFYSHCHHRDLHSFPTRRSSDLSPYTGKTDRETCTRGGLAVVVADDTRVEPARERERTHGDIRLVLTITGKPTPCARSEEHTSELQSRGHLVCRLLLEKKKKNNR